MSSEEHVATPKAVYDLVAETYVRFVSTQISAATEHAIDAALLLAFTELVKQGESLRVADVGCGPGRAAALMAAKGLEPVGVDVSVAMLAVAREAHPHLTFEEGRLDALPFEKGELAGAVCWYSIIYTPPEHLEKAFAELARVVLPGGYVLLAFQSGSGEALRSDRAHGTNLSLTLYRHDLREVSRQLEEVGLDAFATTVREPVLEHETGPQAFVFSRRR